MSSSFSRTPLGIRFGDYVFSHPIPLDRFSVPTRSVGLYVLLMPDPSWGPWHFQPIYFGEFGFQREVHMSVAQQTCCLKIAAGRSLYFALYAVPHQHGWAISQIKKELIDRYQPLSNLPSVDGTTELAHKLNSLEMRVTEQDAVLKLALAAIGQMAQFQQPEPRKRIAGFQPDPAVSRRRSSGKGADGLLIPHY
jgi:hypothetical protein